MSLVDDASTWGATMAKRGALLWFLAILVVISVAFFGPAVLQGSPDWAVLPLVEIVEVNLVWFAREATIGDVPVQQITRGFAALVNAPIEWAQTLLSDGIWSGRGLNRERAIPPLSWLTFGGASVILAYRLGGRRLALGTGFGVVYLVAFGLWQNSMVTLSSVLLSTVIAASLGIFLGIWSFRHKTVEAIVRATMNVMQTIPIFAYLLPTLLLFGYGPSAALIATVAYALPPMVHNTVIALKSVPSELVEAGNIAGCSRRQMMWKVLLPTALPGLSVGLNQVVMMTLNMVIIASMIGAGGLGFDVLTALRKLDIGAGLEAGMAIVVLAVILDRLSQAAATKKAAGNTRKWRFGIGITVFVWIVAATLVSFVVPPAQDWPSAWTISTAEFWNELVSWVNIVAYDTIDAFRTFALLQIMRPLRDFLMETPWSLWVGLITLAGAALGGWRLAAQVFALMFFIVCSGFWLSAMNSVYLILLSVTMAIMIGFPIGATLALSPRLQPSANFVLDTLQTLPTLVYLLPAVMLFKIGDVSAIIAVTSYAVAPAVRYTMVGLARIPSERLEAAAISGCTTMQTLTKVRIPTAFPTLVLGINQTVMMALSMLVIAALVGTKDLGQDVLIALNRSLVGQGIIAGLCVAALALVADALLKAWSLQMSNRNQS